MTINKIKITGTKSTNKKVKTLPKGVSFDKRRNKYVARLVFRTTTGGTLTKYMGHSYKTSQEAAKARKEYILSLV